MLLIDQKSLSHCKKHSTCTPGANMQVTSSAVPRCFPLLLFFQTRRQATVVGLPYRILPPKPQHSHAHSLQPVPLATPMSSDVCMLKCPAGREVLLLASTLSLRVWSNKSECHFKTDFVDNIKCKSQHRVVCEHVGNLPRSKFEFQCDNLLGK